MRAADSDTTGEDLLVGARGFGCAYRLGFCGVGQAFHRQRKVSHSRNVFGINLGRAADADSLARSEGYAFCLREPM